jgi:adenylosuccinate lyase
MLQKATSLIAGLVVHPDRMLQNLQATRGLVFSGQLLLALTQKGVSRETAYEWVQRNAMRVWDENENFQELLRNDADINAHLSSGEIDAVFHLDTYLRNVGVIFERVFGETAGS